MRLWLQEARKRLAQKRRSGDEGVISNSLSALSMSGSAVAVDGPRYMTNMKSDKVDEILYLSVDELERRKYWRSGEEREDIWKRISRPKLSILFPGKKESETYHTLVEILAN